jgi:hypothetical protein
MIARSKQAIRAVAGMYLGLPRSESPESGPCSRFLPCKITRPGLPTLSDWLAWAQARLAAFDPLVAGPAGVFEDLLNITSWTYRE